MHAVELAAEAHYRFVTIHPFDDGNGRTGRLLMNMILMMRGYSPVIIRKNDRLLYIKSLEKPQLVNGEGDSKSNYFKLIAASVDRSLNIYLKAIVVVFFLIFPDWKKFFQQIYVFNLPSVSVRFSRMP